MNSSIKLCKISQWNNLNEIEALYRDAGWWDESSDYSWLNKMIAESACFVVAIDDSHVVGMGRALSDGISDAYIQDICVLKSYQHRGIGTNIVQFLLGELKNKGVDWIGLIGEPGTEKFYRALGFQKMDNYIPMRWHG